MKSTIDHEARLRPVSLVPHQIEALRAGRLRTLILPHVSGSLPRPGDALWVREGYRVRERQRERHRLSLSYAGEARGCHLPWPSCLEKPAPGYKTPDRMPKNLSRFTLLVQSARCCQRNFVHDDEALTAGVIADGEGFGIIGYPFLRPFNSPLEALAYMLSVEQLAEADQFPVAIITFNCVSRNVCNLVMPPLRVQV